MGRYLMFDAIASGGMASVHFGRLLGAVGFSRTVAIKHLHSHYSGDPEFVSMFVDEARLASRIQHPNVAAPLDVVLEDSGEIFLVMEYIHGETLARLLGNARASKQTIPLSVSASIMNEALHGLHAAHEAVDEAGQPLGVVHRDFSPHNIMVGVDGGARVLDFGIAKAVSRCQSTRQGLLKGKLSYMAPEQMRGEPVDRRLDVFAAGIVLWEALTQRRLFKPDDAAAAFYLITAATIPPPSTVKPDLPPALDKIVMKALERDLDKRFQTALEFADALEEAIPLASHRKVGELVERLCSEGLGKRAEKVSNIERSTFDPTASTDPQALLRSGRFSAPQNPADSTTSKTGQTDAGPARAHGTGDTNSLAEIPPSTPPPQLSPPTVPSRRSPWSYVVISSVVLVLGAAGLYQLRGMGVLTNSRKGSQPLTSSPAVQPYPTAPLPAPLPPPPPVPDQLAGGEELPDGKIRSDESKAGEAEPRTSGATSQKASKGKRTKGKTAKSKALPAKKDCDPPFFLDFKGIRRVKPQCL